jgi:hypothetical protein
MRSYFWPVLAMLAVAGPRQGHPLAHAAVSKTLCAVTEANGVAASGQPPDPFVHGTAALSVILGWPDGTVTFKPGGPGFVLKDGALSMKFPWYRGVRGQLTIVGHRLDATAPALRASVPSGYGDIGFQSTALIFPTPGCWEVTGSVGKEELTFVTRVVKIGDGPRPPG